MCVFIFFKRSYVLRSYIQIFSDRDETKLKQKVDFFLSTADSTHDFSIQFSASSPILYVFVLASPKTAEQPKS